MQRNIKRLSLVFGLVVMLSCFLMLQMVFPKNGSAARTFKKKECVDCHDDFAKQYLKMDNQHPGVKDNNCQDCHLSHGIVGKLLLVEEDNNLCFMCHAKEDFNLEKKMGVHTALLRGKCVSCHNPHASNSPNLLAAEGNESCFK